MGLVKEIISDLRNMMMARCKELFSRKSIKNAVFLGLHGIRAIIITFIAEWVEDNIVMHYIDKCAEIYALHPKWVPRYDFELDSEDY